MNAAQPESSSPDGGAGGIPSGSGSGVLWDFRANMSSCGEIVIPPPAAAAAAAAGAWWAMACDPEAAVAAEAKA